MFLTDFHSWSRAVRELGGVLTLLLIPLIYFANT